MRRAGKVFARSLALMAAATAFGVSAAHAEWPEKPITFVVPYSPGGGFDTYVRAVAPEMERILGTEIIVKNLSGAGGRRGAEAVYRADPDGYTIGVMNVPGFATPMLMGEETGYDLGAMTWLGNLATSRVALAVAADSPFRTVAELCAMDRPVKLSELGPGDTSGIAGDIALDLLDCPHVGVTGYRGSSETVVAILRGEVDGTFKTLEALRKYHDTGDLRIILTFEQTPSIEGVQTSADIGRPDFATFRMLRMIGAPPGVPAEIAAKLSDALVGAMGSPKVQEWSVSADYPLDPMSGEEAAQALDEMLDYLTKYKDLMAN